ncbi:MAG TPA: MMPL family transporter [Acidothermaceae bacterium]|nr:MMPL family transporter [Acidothermaceae bacterium]
MRPRTNLTGRVGLWSGRHPWRAIGIWLAFIVIAVVAGGAVGTNKLHDGDQAVGEAGRAQHTIAGAFEQHADEQILLHSSKTTVSEDPQYQAAIRDVVARVQGTELALDVRSPLDERYRNQVSADGHSALVTFQVAGTMDDAATTIPPVLEAVQAAAAAHPGYDIAEAGDASIHKALNDTAGKDFENAERLSVPIALFVLLVTFGALVAALLPLGLALTAVIGATGLLSFASHISGVDSSANSVMLLIGLAVGVDYSLFYVKREREERAKGASLQEALAIAAATSGRAVLISGITVLVALCGMFFTGSKIFVGMGEATVLVVATAVLGSLTVLPALMSLLGHRIERGRIPFIGRLRHAEGESRIWGWVLDRTLARPVVALVVAAAALLGLAAPALSMHTATPGVSDLPHTLPVLKTYDRIMTEFPGGGAPAVVVVTADDVRAPQVAQGIEAMKTAALASGQMAEPISVHMNDEHTVALVDVPLAGNGENAAATHALATLRDEVIPQTIGKVDGVRADVTGMTAGTEDFNALMRARAPIVFAFVLVFAFLLLLLSFRSIVIAAKAIVLNLLSVFASYGVLVAVFQWGWGESLLHFKSAHAVTSWLPLFLFVVLFSLSMDYHVFIISRIREAFDKGDDTRSAIAHGIKSSAGVVTAAATVMVATFLVFASLSQVSMKELGVGLAVAVLLDATIVRGVLLPAAMKLLGEWNWYLPRWLDWIPSISHGEMPVPQPVVLEPHAEERREVLTVS